MEHRTHTMPHDAFMHVKLQIATTKANKAKRLGLKIETPEQRRVDEYVLDHKQLYFGVKNLVKVRIINEEDIITEVASFGSADRVDKYGRAYFDEVGSASRNGKQLTLRIEYPNGDIKDAICTREYFINALDTKAIRHYEYKDEYRIENHFMLEHKRMLESIAYEEFSNENKKEKKVNKPHGPVDFKDALANILDNMLNANIELTDYEE